MKRFVRITWPGWLVAVIIVLNVAIAACGQRDVPRALTHVEAAAPPAGPPCIHEVCGERPVRLKCIDGGAHFCHEYALYYERHCVCDRWATLAPEQDGGAP